MSGFLAPAVLAVTMAGVTPAMTPKPIGLSPQPNPPGKPPTVTLPKGTTATKAGPAQLLFRMPTGATLELKGCRRDQQRRLVADEGHFVPAPGKPGWRAKGATLVGGPKPLGKPLPGDFVKIDDEPTWLPAVVQFTGIIDPVPPG